MNDMETKYNNEEIEQAKYSNDEVLLMRENNAHELYKSLYDFNSRTCVWENGKYGHFVQFERTSLTEKHGEGMRFVQLHKCIDRISDDLFFLLWKENNKIIISGFGECVLRYWGNDLTTLCTKYTRIKYNETADQWKRDNYPNIINGKIELKLYDELKKTEKEKWGKSTIHEFFTQSDNEKLNQCMDVYFEWLDELINEIAWKQSEHTKEACQTKIGNDKESIGKAEQNRFSFRVASIERIYDFCISTKVLDSEIISNINFVNAVHSANFKAIHDHTSQIKSKSKCKYIIYVLSKFMGEDWYLKTAHSINTEPNRCSGITVPLEWKKKVNAIK